MAKREITKGATATLAERVPGKWAVVGHEERGNGLRRANIVFDGVGEQTPSGDVLPEVSDAVTLFHQHNVEWKRLEELRAMLDRANGELAAARKLEESAQKQFADVPTEDNQRVHQEASAIAAGVQIRVDAQVKRAGELWDCCRKEIVSQTAAAACRAHAEAREVNLAAVAELARLAAVTLDLLSFSKLRMEAASRHGKADTSERALIAILGPRPRPPEAKPKAVVDDNANMLQTYGIGMSGPRQFVAEGTLSGIGAV